MFLIYFGPRFIAQPHLIPKSPSQIFALPGDEISLSVETERGLRTTWTYEAQIIPEVPEDPEMAFERGLKDNKISETLVISSLDWRHYGIYVVETEKAGCREAITFNIKHDKGNYFVAFLTKKSSLEIIVYSVADISRPVNSCTLRCIHASSVAACTSPTSLGKNVKLPDRRRHSLGYKFFKYAVANFMLWTC